MSKQTLNVGADPGNQGDGDALRSAAQKIQANFDEIYAELGDGTDLSNGNTAGHVLVADGTKFVNVAMSGDTTIASNGAVTIANDSVEHAMLENRYTAQVDVTSSNSISIDWSTGAVFKLDGALTGTTTITFSNFQIGQCIEICNLQGSVTVNLACVNGGVQDYFYKVGGDYDGSSANLLQVVVGGKLTDSSHL